MGESADADDDEGRRMNQKGSELTESGGNNSARNKLKRYLLVYSVATFDAVFATDLRSQARAAGNTSHRGYR
jgi:hypothetical protein